MLSNATFYLGYEAVWRWSHIHGGAVWCPPSWLSWDEPHLQTGCGVLLAVSSDNEDNLRIETEECGSAMADVICAVPKTSKFFNITVHKKISAKAHASSSVKLATAGNVNFIMRRQMRTNPATSMTIVSCTYARIFIYSKWYVW